MSAVVQQSFDYGAVDGDARDDLKATAERIRLRMVRTASDIVEIGRGLIAVKDRLGHGNFLKWVESEFGMTDRTSRRFIQVARRFQSKSDIVSDLTPTVLYALAPPSTPDEVVAEVVTRTEDGETFSAADIKRMKDEWAAERKKLRNSLEEEKVNRKLAQTRERASRGQLEQLRTESESLRYERDAVKKRLVDAESAAPPPQDGETTVDIWLQQLDAIWEKVPPEAQSAFLTKYGAAS